MNSKRAALTSCKIMVLGILGAAAGAIIYFWGTLSSPESWAFIYTPEFVTWFLINELLFALYPVLGVVVFKPIFQLRKHFIENRLEIIGSAVLLFILLISLPLLGGKLIDLQPLPLVYADVKILLLEAIGFLATALPLSVGIWLTQAAIADTSGKPTEVEIKTYISFRNQLHRLITILGALLSLFILASAALRNASIATGATTAINYPPIYLLLLGAYYALLTVVVYYPAHQTLVSTGYHLLEACFPLPAPNSSSWRTLYANRKELEEHLELKIGLEQRFLTSITLLAPFFSSIFSLLIAQ